MKNQDNGLKERTISAMVWSALGTSGATIITFLSNMILARILIPEDFGCIGMLQIFIVVGDAFVGGGFGQALIQKKDPTHVDYSTVFIWNLIASLAVYFILFFCAPAIARFYRMPVLCKILRIQSINLLIHAFIVVQNNQLRKNLRFKELSIRSVFAALTGTVVAIVIAYNGGGVWSLVASSLVSSVMSVLLLWKMSDWRPTLEFSWGSFRTLFSFGGLIALSNILERLFSNIQGVVIGRWYSAADMGYYSQANKLEEIPNQTLSQIVNQVSYPLFSELQNDITRLRTAVKKNIKTLVYINFPLCVLMLTLASPLIHLFYGAKWDESIPYFQILCIGGLVSSTNAMNMNVVKALGKGKTFLGVQLTKRFFRLAMIVIGALWGVKGLIWGVVISQYFDFIINAIINQKYINYGLFSLIGDIGKTMIIAAISGLIIYWVGLSIPRCSQYFVMVIQAILFSLIYIGVTSFMKFEAFETYVRIIKRYLSRIR